MPDKNTEELISEAKLFFDTYKKEIGDSVRKGKKVVFINFEDLASNSPILAEALISQPEEITQLLEIALEESGLIKTPRIRFNDLPGTQKVRIRTIRAEHLNQLIFFEGLVRQASEVRPQVVNAKFECPSCGTVISVLQIEKKFREPSRCSCGRKGQFRLISKIMVDAQRLVIEESPESLIGGEQPRRINVFLKEDLVEPIMEEKTTPGSKVRVLGVLKEVPVPLPSGAISTRFDLAIEASNIIPLETTYEELDITEEDEMQIQELAADPELFTKLRDSIAPSIWGYEEIKEALVLQMFGGVRKVSDDGSVSRGDIHLFLIGDPGVAKSLTLKFISDIAPRGRYIVGKAATGAGITATVVRDEFLRGWSLEAGAMVLANKGIICIDEIEKMDPNDRSAMHEALEQQCYHHDTIISLADGSEIKIGKLVEDLLEKNKNKIIKGKDCLILPTNNLEVLTTNFKNIFKTKVNRISKHKAFDKFIKIKFSNGRSIVITPEHPVFIAKNGKTTTIRADKIKIGDSIPIPLKMPIEGKPQSFNTEIENKRAIQKIRVPNNNCKEIFKIAGYLISEGSKETNRKKTMGVNFTNKDQRLLDDFEDCMNSVFNITPYKQPRIDDHEVRYMYRYISTELTNFFMKNMPELMKLSGEKQIPQILMKGERQNISQMLSTMFEGDGHVSIKKRTIRVGYSTKSKRLAEQVQDLLLRFGIRSNLNRDREYFKVLITSYNNLKKFLENISFITPEKNNILKKYLKEKTIVRTVKNIIPKTFNEKIIEIIKQEDIKQIGKYKQYDIIYDHSKRKDKVFSFSRNFLENLIKLVKKPENIEFLKTLTNDIGWEKVNGIEIIENENEDWVYDITIEPNHAFISQATILHNTVTISKANVQACYSEDTEVLTEQGWKKYQDVKNLKIAQFNPKTKTIHFLPHKGPHTYDYKGKMYNFKNKRNDILVTPNHKMLIKGERKKHYQEFKAEEIPYSRINVLNSGDYINNKPITNFILPPIRHKQNRKHPKYTHQHHPKKIPLELWLEFLGYYLTEGGTETAPTIGITQKDKSNIKKIKACLQKLSKIIGFTLTEIKKPEYTKLKITNTQLYTYLKKLGNKSYKKRFPFEDINLSLLSKQQLEILYNAMMLGDGASDGRGYFSTSSELIDAFQSITCLLGKSANKNLAYLGKDKGNRKDLYRVSISDKIELSLRKDNGNIKRVNYQGKVFCFSTQTGFFITRRNGKIAIQGNSLQAQTSVLAAGNPKFGRFEPLQSITQQIDLPPALINRFDLIFILRDLPNASQDDAIATHVLNMHQMKGRKSEVERDLFKKYIAYAKQKIVPKLTEEAVEEIKSYYVKLRNMQSVGDTQSIPISARQLQGLVRLAEAHAKARLSLTVEKEDSQVAIKLTNYYLMQVGYDPETKSFDIDRFSTRVSSSQRSKIILLRETIKKLEDKYGKQVPLDVLRQEMENLSDPEFEEALEKLKKSGDVFQPKKGFVQDVQSR
ncbi:MAG: LAGLIDADG family homing endonuclease, partial [Nanoarchaeota archaeon]